MRKTVKERYGEALSKALTELREIKAQLEASGNTSNTVTAAEKWKQHTAELIERFGLPEEIRFFNIQRQCGEDSTTGGFTEAVGAYDEMLVRVLQALPESDIKRGYDEEVERPLSAIDDLLGQIGDLYRLATTGQRISAQTAVDGLERWIDRAYKILKHIVGEDEAGQLYSMRNEHGSIEYQVATYVTYLRDLKEEIEKYPEQVLAQEQSTETPSNNGEPAPDALSIVEQILSRFHAAVIQLRHRHADRQTLDVKDEYDVQDLLHVLLRTRFDDIRAEEVSPSYAGGSSRTDFVVKGPRIAIEVKFPNASLRDAKTGEQLLIDIARYQEHPDCRSLVCFIYDPNHCLRNPAGLVADLSKRHGELEVRVYVLL